MSEFSLIARYFQPLTTAFPGAHRLQDDAACITPPAGTELVISTDALVAGVHFLGTEAPGILAQKALRVNLSDLAAKGAAPLCYFLSLMAPAGTPEAWFAAFAAGLAQDQQRFAVHLAGGDTTRTPGPLAISITVLGTVPKGSMLTRSGACVGDALCVSGTLGLGAQGLEDMRAGITLTPAAQHYQCPEPQLALGLALRGIATACMDVSDGLVQDASHLARASGLSLVMEAARVPHAGATLEQALTGGDDYALLFTQPTHLPVPEGCTIIGRAEAGEGVVVRDENGAPMPLKKTGWQHF